MAVYKGREGTVRFAGSTVGEVISWDVSITAQTQDSTRMGDVFTKDETVHVSWAGSVEAFWDPADVGQSAAFGGTGIIGNQVALILYPRGSAGFPNVNLSGTATIEEMSIPQAHGELIKRTIKFKGYGAPVLTGM